MQPLRTTRDRPENPSADSPSGPNDQLQRVLAKDFGLHVVEDSTAEESQPYRLCVDADPHCPHCLGHGFVRRNVSVSDPDFGKAFLCECAAPQLRARRIARMEARIPKDYQGFRFDNYPAEGDQAALARVRAFATSEEGSLFLWGKVRTGKTSLAASLSHELIARGVDVLFIPVPELLEQLRRSFDHEEGELTAGEITDLVKQAGVVVFDDIGAEKVSEWVLDVLYRLINFRQSERRRTVYTSNKSLVELESRLSDRIAWRIKAHCGDWVVKVAGQNLNDREGA